MVYLNATNYSETLKVEQIEKTELLSKHRVISRRTNVKHCTYTGNMNEALNMIREISN